MKNNQKIALVTGSNKGIGNAIANKYESENIIVIRNGTSEFNHHNYVKADLGKKSDILKLKEYVVKHYNKLDILVNNAAFTEFIPHDDLDSLKDETIDKILVIGPTSSFFPWEDEYRLCFGRKPHSRRIKGELANDLPNLNHELFLMHFSTAMNKKQEIIEFMSKNNVALIIDESHNIKSPEQGRWARTALDIGPYAKRKIILTGTPMPNTAADLWVQINFLWPHHEPLGNDYSYIRYAKTHGIGKWKNHLDPLFTRVTKRR